MLEVLNPALVLTFIDIFYFDCVVSVSNGSNKTWRRSYFLYYIRVIDLIVTKILSLFPVNQLCYTALRLLIFGLLSLDIVVLRHLQHGRHLYCSLLVANGSRRSEPKAKTVCSCAPTCRVLRVLFATL